MDADASTIAQARAQLAAQAPDLVLLVLPECWFAARVFCAMDTQWQWCPVGQQAEPRRVGLRYEALPLVLAALRGDAQRRPLAEVLPQLAVMEEAALKALATT